MTIKAWLVVFGIMAAATVNAATPDEILANSNLTLPPAASPVANYVPVVRTGNLLFLAGHLPRNEAGQPITGKVGDTIPPSAANRAARQTALALLATLKQELGSLDRVRRIVRVEGYVNSAADFTGQSGVIDGCSDLLIELFGDRGRHARLAVGVAALPLNAAVEIAMIVEVD